MNLHRVGEVADYEKADFASLSRVQKIALASHGLLTPANVVTLVGLGLTISGLRDIHNGDRSARPLIKIGIGRILDFVDGQLAELFGTKSKVGEAADSVADKISAFYGLYVLNKKAEENVIPKAFVEFMIVQNSLNSVFTLIGKARGREVHSSKNGKLATATQWLAIGAYLVSDTIKDNGSLENEKLFRVMGERAAGLTVALGTLATVELAEAACSSGTKS